MANSYVISTFQATVPFSELYSQSGHIHKDKNNNNKNAQTHPVLAASKAWFCCWKRTVATVQLEEIFQETGNTLAVNELFFARMSDSSCAPVNSLPWETKPAPSEDLKKVSQGSSVGAATDAWPINHHSLKFILIALFVYLGHTQGPGKGPGRPQCRCHPPLNCALVRFPHLQHHDIWNWVSLHISYLSHINCIYFHALVFIKLSGNGYVCPLFSFLFF